MTNNSLRYRELLKNHRAFALAAVREIGAIGGAQILDASVIDEGDRPYVLLKLENTDRFVACAGGTILQLSESPLSDMDGLIYLPYICLTQRAEPDDFEHELGHLDDILRHIESEPSYVADAHRLGMDSLVDSHLLFESVRFEVRKLFLFETAEFGRAYDRGTRSIDVPFFFGIEIEVPVDTREEFVRISAGAIHNEL